MNVALKRPWTTEQFLAWEERQELRYEFDGFQPVAREGGTAAHSAIQRNLIFALTGGLRGKPCRPHGSEFKPCRPHGSELKIKVADRSICYPDAFVEVLSESSATDDFVTKNAEYRATPSVKRYVILEQAKAAAAVFSRKGDDWVADLLTGNDAILRMPEIGLDIPLSEIYTDVEFDAPDDAMAAQDQAAADA
jgi:Uma2 family endonuclease